MTFLFSKNKLSPSFDSSCDFASIIINFPTQTGHIGLIFLKQTNKQKKIGQKGHSGRA